jgi:hypothetical protein
MDIELPPDFSEFLRLLDAKGVEYLLIGGYAVAYHGYPRSTQDMDVWVAISPQNASRLVQALREFGFESPQLDDELFLKQDSIVRMGVPPMRIEIATSISGVSFDECYRARIVEDFEEVPVSIISLKHLKKNKQSAGRHRDLDDLEHLP